MDAVDDARTELGYARSRVIWAEEQVAVAQKELEGATAWRDLAEARLAEVEARA